MKEPFDNRPHIERESIEEFLKKQEQENKQKETQQDASKNNRKAFDRIKEAWNDAVAWILTVGIITAISSVLGLLFYWKDALKLIETVKEVGMWRFLFTVVGSMLGVIGIFNIIVAVVNMLEIIGKKFRPAWIYVYLTITVLGFFAAFYFLA